MTYPIFNSFINQLENQLNNKQLNIKTFKTWHEDRINATGLEIIIDVRNQNNFIKEVSINFDWDRFRETVLAQQLDGLSEHPMLQETSLKSVTVEPEIDIEVSWIFDEEKSKISFSDQSDLSRLENASRWMEQISKDVNELLADEDGITRWHIEVEGNHEQKYVSAARLISYFQYSLNELKSLNEAHTFVRSCMQELIRKSQEIRAIADDRLQEVA